MGAASQKLGQFGLKGNVVNVPVSVDKMISILPRQMNETQTIQIKLMRMMKFKTPYLYENVRPRLIYEAIMFLKETDLYKKHNIEISENWLDQFDNIDETRFDPTSDDEESNDIEKSQSSNKPPENKLIEDFETDLNQSSCSESNFDSDSDSDYDENTSSKIQKAKKFTDSERQHATTDTLLDSMNPDDIAIRFAPGEGQMPLSIIYDNNCEELSFPEIYCGNEITNLVRPTDRIKSELRMYDPRACRPSKIFFNYKMLQNQRLSNAISICLRKKSTLHTASDMLKKEYVQSLISTDAGFKFLENERNSPPFLEKATKNLKAFVRQNDIPTFFITFSAAEVRWPPLLISLMKRLKNKTITVAEAEALTYEEKSELIRNDPVTCARYFDMRVKKLISLFKRKKCIFNNYSMIDYSIRVEFQNRGSPHCHGIFWIGNAPKYIIGNEASHDECVKFIDEFITCKNDPINQKYMSSQFHKHTFTCRKNNSDFLKKRGHKKCRFHFPKCPLPHTLILEPLDPSFLGYDVHKQNFSNIKKDLTKRLEKKRNKETKVRESDLNDSFEKFLDKLNLSYDNYILALRTSIRDSQVFLVRKLDEIMINNYNSDILPLVQSNMDIQYILSVWGCVKYICS